MNRPLKGPFLIKIKLVWLDKPLTQAHCNGSVPLRCEKNDAIPSIPMHEDAKNSENWMLLRSKIKLSRN